jgi:hypothetical protein
LFSPVNAVFAFEEKSLENGTDSAGTANSIGGSGSGSADSIEGGICVTNAAAVTFSADERAALLGEYTRQLGDWQVRMGAMVASGNLLCLVLAAILSDLCLQRYK